MSPTSSPPWRNDTMLICGTLVLLVCICAVTYLVVSGRPAEVAVTFMGPIVLAVLATTYNATKLDRVEQKVDKAVHQTNGGLDARINEAVERSMEQKLRNVGLPPIPSGDVPMTRSDLES